MSRATAPTTRPPILVTLALCPDCAGRAAADHQAVATLPVRPLVALPALLPLAEEEPTWEDAEWR